MKKNSFLKSLILILSFNFTNDTIICAASSKELEEPKALYKGPIAKYEEDVAEKLNEHFPREIGNIISQYHKTNINDENSLEEDAAVHLNVNYPLYAPGTHKLLQPLEILGLTPGMKYSPREIQSARRKKLLLFHPDKNANISTQAYTRISQFINSAFDQLSPSAAPSFE